MEKENSIGLGNQPLVQFADIAPTPPVAEEKGVMLFGVRLYERSGSGCSMRKSLSLGNLGLYNSHLLYGHASPHEGSESGGGDAAARDGYASDGMVQAASSSARERKKGVPWTEDEHKMFLVGLQKLGKGDWRGISRNFVPTRTPTQVASHAQKYYLRQANMNKRKRRSSLFDIPADYNSSTPVPIPVLDGSQNLVTANMSRSSDSNLSCSPFRASKHDTAASSNLPKAPFQRPPISPLQNLSSDLFLGGAHNPATRVVTMDLVYHQNDAEVKAMQAETGFLENITTSPSSSLSLPYAPSSCPQSTNVFRPTAMLPSVLARIDEAGEMPSPLSLTIGPPSSLSSSPPFGTEPNSISLKLEQPLATRHSAFHSGGAAALTGSGMGSGSAISVV